MLRTSAAALTAGICILSSGVARAEASCQESLTRGRGEQEEGKLLAARQSYDACTKKEWAPDIRTECTRKHEELERVLPTLSFVVKDAADHDLDAKISVDGSVPFSVGRAVALDPGTHEVTWSTDTGARGSQRITVVEAQKGRIVTLTAELPAEAKRKPGGDGRHPRRSATPWILLGTSAALVTTAGFLQLLARNEDSDSRQMFYHASRDDLSAASRQAFIDSGRDKYDAASANEAAAITCVALGVAAAVAGVMLLYRGRTEPTVAISPSAGGFRGSF
jgi:hypothetical protein